jgi:hypothetical protein
MIKQETMFLDTTAEIKRLQMHVNEQEKRRRIERSIFTEMAACERMRSSAMESYCRKGDDESKVMYAYFDGAFHTIWNLIKENHLEVEYHAFTRARQRTEREENNKGMSAGRTGTGEGAKDVL